MEQYLLNLPPDQSSNKQLREKLEAIRTDCIAHGFSQTRRDQILALLSCAQKELLLELLEEKGKGYIEGIEKTIEYVPAHIIEERLKGL